MELLRHSQKRGHGGGHGGPQNGGHGGPVGHTGQQGGVGNFGHHQGQTPLHNSHETGNSGYSQGHDDYNNRHGIHQAQPYDGSQTVTELSELNLMHGRGHKEPGSREMETRDRMGLDME